MEFTCKNNCVYAEDAKGRRLAEITYPRWDEQTVNIDHTYVDPSLRGQGIADTLIRAALDDIKGQGLEVIATCSYAKRWLSQHPEFNHMLCPRHK